MAIEYRSRLAANAMDFAAMLLLVEVMAASGPPEDRAGADRLAEPAADASPGADRPTFRAIGLYEAGKLPECVELCRQVRATPDPSLRLHSLLALKRTKEAADDPSFAKLCDDPWDVLAVSLAWSSTARRTKPPWRERAIAKLETLGPEPARGDGDPVRTSRPGWMRSRTSSSAPTSRPSSAPCSPSGSRRSGRTTSRPPRGTTSVGCLPISS